MEKSQVIVKLWNQPHVIYQTADSTSGEMENYAVIVHVDNGGALCLQQLNDTIVLDWDTIPELCKLLTELRKERKK